MNVKPLTPFQYIEILEFIKKHHSFCLFRNDKHREYVKENFPKLNPDYGFNIKYITNSFDTRDASIWSLNFRCNANDYSFRTNLLVGSVPEKNPKFDNLYDIIMAFLKGELENSEWYIIKEVER